MYKGIKRFICVLLSFIMILEVNPAYAKNLEDTSVNTDNNYPISVSLSSDKDSYGTFDRAEIKVDITNISSEIITDISAVSCFAETSPSESSQTLYINDETLEPGETLSFSYSAYINYNKLNFFQKIFLMFKKIFRMVDITYAPKVNFDNGREKRNASVEITFGKYNISETINVWFKQTTKIINTDNSEEFSNELIKLVNKTLNDNFDSENALKDEFYAARIILKSSDISQVDFNSFNADTVIINEDGLAVLQFDDGSEAKKCTQSLNEMDCIDFAEPDVYECFAPNEVEIEEIPSFSGNSWGESFINADKYAYYLESNRFFDMVTVAVVDSGIDMDHPFLKSRITGNGWDYIENDNNPEDENGHGTHVAGTIVDCTNNLNVKVMPVRVLDKNGNSFRSSVVSGITHASDNGANIINLSLGGKHSDYIDNAIEEAAKKGIVCIVAAGNGKKVYNETGVYIEGDSGNRYDIVPDDTINVCPAHIDGVIVVGAIDSKKTIGVFSNYGASVDLVAPGLNIISSYKNGLYAKSSGTSMAAPHVSAAAAMLLLENPNRSPGAMETYIKEHCVSISEFGANNFYGSGYLDLYSLIPDCNVDFYTNGGNSIDSIKVKNSTSFVLPEANKKYNITVDANGGAISKTSYTYTANPFGWYNNGSFSGVRYSVGESYQVLKDSQMYVKWANPKLYEFSIEEPKRTGFSFDGWHTKPVGGTKYSTSSEIDEDKQLYAHWVPNAYSIKWSDNTGYKITVSRTSSPYADAAIGSISNNGIVYYGDKLKVTYSVDSGYKLNTFGATDITVTGNVDSDIIYATATPESYKYNISYRSINGTDLGSSSATYKFGTTNTITPPSKPGYVTPSAQTVVWDATSAKTIVFTYTPTGVGNFTASGTISTSPTITYSARVEQRNRTANSVQIRVCWNSTIQKGGWTVYGQRLNVTAGGNTQSVDLLKAGGWSSTNSARSTGEKSTGWITVPLSTTNATSVNLKIYYYQFNYNNLDMNKYDGTPAVNTTWNISVPAY